MTKPFAAASQTMKVKFQDKFLILLVPSYAWVSGPQEVPEQIQVVSAVFLPSCQELLGYVVASS